MSSAILSLVLDGLILVCLGGAIYYAFRLSNALAGFRQNRKELQSLITDLSVNVDQALRAIEGLKNASAHAGQDLQNVIKEAKGLKEELQLMNDAGNSLAGRLENLAEKNSKIVQGYEPPGRKEDLESLFSGPKVSNDRDTEDDSPFSIQDREYEDLDFSDDHLWDSVEDEDDLPDELQSEAEKDLYRALQKKKTSGGRF